MQSDFEKGTGLELLVEGRLIDIKDHKRKTRGIMIVSHATLDIDTADGLKEIKYEGPPLDEELIGHEVEIYNSKHGMCLFDYDKRTGKRTTCIGAIR